MTKKLLFLLDTDSAPSVFDTVVGYDGGADHIIGYGGVTPESVAALVDGTIYTRGPKEKQSTAIFVGGSSMIAHDREEWERTFNVCWGGVYHCTRAFLPMLQKAGHP